MQKIGHTKTWNKFTWGKPLDRPPALWNPKIITKFKFFFLNAKWECRPEEGSTWHGEHVVPAKVMLHISMETGPATQSSVAEVEPCSTSAFWSRRPPATPCDSTATSRGADVGRWLLRFWYCESAFRVSTGITIGLPKVLAFQELNVPCIPTPSFCTTHMKALECKHCPRTVTFESGKRKRKRVGGGGGVKLEARPWQLKSEHYISWLTAAAGYLSNWAFSLSLCLHCNSNKSDKEACSSWAADNLLRVPSNLHSVKQNSYKEPDIKSNMYYIYSTPRRWRTCCQRTTGPEFLDF